MYNFFVNRGTITAFRFYDCHVQNIQKVDSTLRNFVVYGRLSRYKKKEYVFCYIQVS